MLISQPKTKSLNLKLAFVLYACITGVLAIRHTMWRDELQLWLLSSKSSNIGDLLSNTSHELRPLGYFLFCWVVSRFTANPEILKVTNWLISISLAYVVLFRIQVKEYVKVLFLFGFIPLIGYSHIAEDYMLSTLLFIILIKMFSETQNKPVFFLVACLLANIHILFLLASSGFVFIYFLDSITFKRNFRELAVQNRKLISLVLLYVVSLLLAASRISQTTAGSYRPKTTDIAYIVKRSFTVIASACFPFYDFQTGGGGHRIVFVSLLFLGGLIIAGLFFLALLQEIRIAAAIMISHFLLIAGMVFGYSSYWWHFGSLFICIFGSLLLLQMKQNIRPTTRLPMQLVTALLLISQVIALFIGPRTNLWERQPYSTAESTAAYVESVCDESCTIIMPHETTGVGVSAYLGGREIYYVDKGQFGSFAEWRAVIEDPTWIHLIEAAKKFNKSIFVTSVLTDPPPEIITLKAFSGAVWTDENFTISKLAP